jgi:glutamyl-tRNA synthetase
VEHDAVTWEADELEPPLRALAEARGWKAGDLFMAIRVAVTGRAATPPLFDTLVALGRERTLARLEAAEQSLVELAESASG